MIGKTLSHYRVVEKIGAGGMGEVYRARDKRLERDVALKVLPTGTLSDEAARKRFRKEALALSKLNHPNIATVHDFDTQDGVDFLVMELVEGVTLSDKLAVGPLGEKEITRLGGQVAEALEEAHEQGVVHRDLKPGNVMVTAKGQVKVLDFGLAKLVRPEVASATATTESFTETQAAAGTLPYMAPEQLRGEQVDARSDIYAAGAVLYEMATGQRPFPETQGPRLIDAILNRAPQPPSGLNRRVSPVLENIILKALEKEPENRYQSVKELAVDLRRLAAGAGIDAGRVSTDSKPRRKRRTRRRRIQSLAVLPLVNLSRDPDQEYFADGMTETLIANLAKLRALKIISRTSAMRYKGTDKSLPEIAEELNVDGVVEGSVLRVGQRVRITAQLIHAATDSHLWAESYERDLQDVLLLQSEVARAIAREIQVAVTPEETRRLASARRVNPEAYEAYLKGRFHEYRTSPEDSERALDYFNLALEKDPDYALAYTGIGDVWGAAGGFGLVPPRESVSKGKPAALKAVELDDTLAEGHEILGRYRFFYEWDWAAGERQFQRAIALSPNNPYLRLGYWSFLRVMKRPAEAMAQVERALELDPFSFFFQTLLGWQLLDGRRYDDAIEQFRKALVTEPNFLWSHWGLWSAFHQKRVTEDALAEAKRFFALLGSSEAAAAMERGYAESGYRGAMSLGAETLVAQAKVRYVQPTHIARLYAHDEQKDLALEWLEKGYEERYPFLVWLNEDLDWDSLRSDPRFQSLLRRLNFPE